jgi:hypothetical protein
LVALGELEQQQQQQGGGPSSSFSSIHSLALAMQASQQRAKQRQQADQGVLFIVVLFVCLCFV